MNFDYIIGNPPYQDETIGDNKGFAPPVYDKFIDGAYQIGDKVELIHPARFLFNAGSTPKQWNKKMLNDPHLKVLSYEPDASKIFSNTTIVGGLVVSYHDNKKDYGVIGTFTPFMELNSILHKVQPFLGKGTMADISVSAYAYHFTRKMHEEYPDIKKLQSKGHELDLKSNVIDNLSSIFFSEKPKDGRDYFRILGISKGKRIYKYIRKDYVNIDSVPNSLNYKIILSAADGASGTIGKPVPARVLNNMIIEGPKTGNTESFISIGSFINQEEAENALKYIKTNFLRTLVGALKVTQHITPGIFIYVPLQDFTSSSDIDWSKSIHDIDLQLYAKYGLDAAETAFIEKMVKEME